MLLLVVWLAAQTEEVPATRLVYLAGRYEGVCPTEVEVQEGIARRIGRSPFSEPPTRIVVLALEGDADDKPARARTEMFDTGFTSLGARVIESGDGCRELVEAAELAVSIALAPTLALAPKPEPKPVEPRLDVEPLKAEVTPVPEPVEVPEKPSLLPAGVHLVVGAGLNASLFLGPDSAVGANLSAALRVDELELRLERREHLPGYLSTLPNSTVGPVVHGAAVITAAPCGHLPIFSIFDEGDRAELTACVTGSLGSVWGVGAYVGGSPYAGVGGRLGAGWSDKDLRSFRAWTQVELNLVNPEFYAFNAASPWKQDAPVNVTFGVTYEIPWHL